MKMKKLGNFRPVALVAIGVFLGRGAHADTTLTFDSDAASCTPPQQQNPNAPPGITNFGSYAAASSGGVTVSGFGTPNIGLAWGGSPSPDTRWEYYNTPATPWAGVVQLQGSSVGSTELLSFIPNSASASAVIKSFRFDAYYNSNERFTYSVSVTSGTNVLSGPTTVSFLSDGTKNHPVNINYTGAPGQTLKLRIARVASTLGAGEIEGNQYNNAIDDIAFAQTPATTFPAGPQVVSVTPADGTTGPATSAPPYAASITNGPTLTVAAPIQLKLDGSPVSPPPTISSAAGLTNVSYPGAALLLSSGSHVYTLTYADNLGAFYTNEVVFSTIYATLPTAYAIPSGAGITRGFTYRSVAVNQDTTNILASTVARAKSQLAGTLIDVSTGMPFTNTATLGPNPDGSFNVDGVLNFNDLGTGAGNFPDDELFPGLDTGPYNWFSTEALLFLDLPAGYYRMGVNSDDGFQFNVLPPQGVPGSTIQLGFFDNGRSASDTLFDFLVQTSGVYPFQLIYFESTGSASCELFSVTNLVTGGKVLINDPAEANAIKSYRVLKPRITNIVRSGPNAVINWAYGTPPFQVQMVTNLNNLVWTDSGLATSNRTANVPVQSGTGFIRVYGK
jgi:hypothetical protein